MRGAGPRPGADQNEVGGGAGNRRTHGADWCALLPPSALIGVPCSRPRTDWCALLPSLGTDWCVLFPPSTLIGAYCSLPHTDWCGQRARPAGGRGVMAAPHGPVPGHGGSAATPERFVPLCAPVVPTREISPRASGWLQAAQGAVLTGILARGKVLERNKRQTRR